MKAASEKIAVLMLFIVCACWQSTVAFSQGEVGKKGDSTEIVAEASPSPQSDQIMPAGEAREMANVEMPFSMVRTVGGMGLVVCLMIGIYFAVKKIAPKYFPGAVSAKNMKIVETLSMGDRRSISVIEVANNRFLIGNTAHQINLLTALPETISLVPHPDESSSHSNEKTGSRSIGSFRNLFEVEKKRSPHHEGNPLPENIRTKMRQLRDALER